MRKEVDFKDSKSWHSQQGGAKMYAIVGIAVVALLIHAGYNYLPVVYQGENFKQEMRGTIINVAAIPGSNLPGNKMGEKLKERLRKVATENGVPANAVIEVSETNANLKARVRFERIVPIIPFGIYDYHYQFDHSANS